MVQHAVTGATTCLVRLESFVLDKRPELLGRLRPRRAINEQWLTPLAVDLIATECANETDRLETVAEARPQHLRLRLRALGDAIAVLTC